MGEIMNHKAVVALLTFFLRGVALHRFYQL